MLCALWNANLCWESKRANRNFYFPILSIHWIFSPLGKNAYNSVGWTHIFATNFENILVLNVGLLPKLHVVFGRHAVRFQRINVPNSSILKRFAADIMRNSRNTDRKYDKSRFRCESRKANPAQIKTVNCLRALTGTFNKFFSLTCKRFIIVFFIMFEPLGSFIKCVVTRIRIRYANKNKY